MSIEKAGKQQGNPKNQLSTISYCIKEITESVSMNISRKPSKQGRRVRGKWKEWRKGGREGIWVCM